MNAVTTCWQGWLKPAGKSWAPVAHANDPDECWKLLLAVPCDARDAEREVLPAGTHPESRKKPR